MRKNRVFFYVQHLLGIGHTVRAALLADEMAKSGLAVTLVNGGAQNGLIKRGPQNIVQLPVASAKDASFSSIVDENGLPINKAWRDNRRDELLAAYNRIKPDLLLVESFPFGRWSFRSEILPLLECAKPLGPVLCSIRDILVPKIGSNRNREVVKIINNFFSGVLIHGDAAFIKIDETFTYASHIRGKIHYTGYVAPTARKARNISKEEIIVSVGGGATGLLLISTAIALANSSAGKNWRWRIIMGPNFPKKNELSFKRASNMVFERFRPDFRTLLSEAVLSISQAGYNTIMDILVSRIRNILVPFGRNGQTEQPLRAKKLADENISIVVNENKLSPETLHAAIQKALLLEAPNINKLNISGATNTAQKIKAVMGIK